MPITIIHCWSAPRSRSTALLYSFEARGDGKDDTVALDEPLYRRWLGEKISGGNGNYGISRPYAEPFLRGEAPAEGDNDEEAWRWEREEQCFNERVYHAVKSLVDNGKQEDGCIFVKHMAKFSHLFNFDTNWETDSVKGYDCNESLARGICMQYLSDNKVEIQHKHLLLIRDPISCLGSWMGKSGDVHGNNPRPDEVGVTQLLDVYSEVLGSSMSRGSEEGDDVLVIDSDDLAAYPRKSLQDLCAAFRIEYRDSMLKWQSGPHKCDGPWAKWWYHDVWESSGWHVEDADGSSGLNHPRTQKYRTVPPTLLPALRMSIPAFNFLKTLTSSHQSRAVTTPPSGRLYEDPRNEDVLVYVGTPSTPTGRGEGRIIPREMAAISPFDSSVQGGDATWEGIRIYNGRIFHLDHHLDRLFRSAKALGFENMHTRSEITEAIFRVLAANGMRDGAHMRLTLTRGEKCTSSMNPYFNVYGTTLIILPEWKPTEGATTYDNTKGVSLITAGTCRRSPPSTLDNKIHHNNMIQNILPKIQANLAGAADSIMLDVEGFVAETNATNLFLVRFDRHGPSMNKDDDKSDFDGAVLVTPTADACLPGITRDTVLLLANELGIKTEVRRVSLSEFYSADEVFTTGTMGELTPVTRIDGRVIGWKNEMKRGVVTELLQKTYKEAVKTRLDWSTEIPSFC
eukprot:CAMPEP_0183729772 /NCGR_PEP_ID=MMETSP0737-20130205/31159_1 /TAXON_ID=385413 /ORGANISM="Thalassiosira miniscula, Strain CCMP1093" /LENGTH=681 /DNA_ID=CAMNT_0025962053 /DNA_START=97 /DNA_END=2142 /DNA_ORIENTATION=-